MALSLSLCMCTCIMLGVMKNELIFICRSKNLLLTHPSRITLFTMYSYKHQWYKLNPVYLITCQPFRGYLMQKFDPLISLWLSLEVIFTTSHYIYFFSSNIFVFNNPLFSTVIGYQVLLSIRSNFHLYGFKYSYQIQIIYAQLYGFK